MEWAHKRGTLGLYLEQTDLNYFGLCKQHKVQKVWGRINIDQRLL